MKASEYSEVMQKLREILIEGNYGIQSNPNLFIESSLIEGRNDPNYQEIPEGFVILQHRVIADPSDTSKVIGWIRLYAHKDYDLEELLVEDEFKVNSDGSFEYSRKVS